jgi:hypothetical protein
MLRALVVGSSLIGSLALASACSGVKGMSGTGDDDVGELPDAGDQSADAAPNADAIVIPPDQLDQWVWVQIPGMVCGDGSPSGVGVRFTAASRNLVIWFQGNGVCYDAKSCAIYRDLLVGMGPDPLNHMWWGDNNQGQTGIFNRDDPTNPFRNDNFVVLPHCTVDGHTADKQSSYLGLPTFEQHGYANATAALHRVVATFPDASRVVVAGFSAGGIGATANYHQIAAAFESVGQPSPFLIADSGPLMRDPYLSQVARNDLRAGWGLDDTVYQVCTECQTAGPGAAYNAIAARHPGVRQSVLSSYADSVAGNLYRLLNYDINFIDGDRFRRGLLDLAAGSPEVRVFYYGGDRHGAMPYRLADSPGLVEFLNAQLSGDPSWSSVIQ